MHLQKLVAAYGSRMLTPRDTIKYIKAQYLIITSKKKTNQLRKMMGAYLYKDKFSLSFYFKAYVFDMHSYLLCYAKGLNTISSIGYRK
jgi:hypothetical protein